MKVGYNFASGARDKFFSGPQIFAFLDDFYDATCNIPHVAASISDSAS